MKLLIFSPYYPPHIGGLETHSDEFNRHLSEKGASVVVFTPQLPADATESEARGNVRIVRFPAFEIISNYPLPKFWTLRFWQVFLPLFQTKYDFIISRTRFFFSSFLALLCAKATRTKLVHIEHGSDFVRLSSPLKTAVAKLYDYTLGFLVFRFSDINISISQAVRSFVQKFDKRESPVIYRGMDFDQLDTIAPDESLKQQFPGKIIIGTVARLYKWKGIEHSIAAIRLLPESTRSKITFIIIGNGEDYDRLRKLSRDLPVEMLGNLPRERAVSIMKSFDIYIHSSLPGGGLSTSLLEAMYCRCAVIATPNEGADEIIVNNETGLIIPTTDSEKIKQSIIHLADSPEKRSKLGEKAKRIVQDQFSWKNSSAAYLRMLEKISEKRNE